jgi:hypothetical protein
VRTPVAAAPMAMDMALCSLSAGMKVASHSPSKTKSDSFSMISVCGVMG